MEKISNTTIIFGFSLKELLGISIRSKEAYSLYTEFEASQDYKLLKILIVGEFSSEDNDLIIGVDKTIELSQELNAVSFDFEEKNEYITLVYTDFFQELRSLLKVSNIIIPEDPKLSWILCNPK